MKPGDIIVIQGPTASGKTGVGVALAQMLKAEIISADSRQFYREMGIGTAKPYGHEMQGIPHHFVNSLSIHDPYSAGDFERDALRLIDDLLQRQVLPIVAGGSGLYIKALLEGLDDLPSDPKLRASLNAIFAEKGIEPLQEKLKALDPEHYAIVDQHNPMRLMRAIELLRSSGKAMAELQKGSRKVRPFRAIKIGLELPRAELYARINARVDDMFVRGLEDEARDLQPFRHLQALQTVGYSELFAHFDGVYGLEEAKDLIKRNSRRYAKRQLTWLRKDEEITWFHPSDLPGMMKFIEAA